MSTNLNGSEEVSSQEMTREVLMEIGLSDEEIDLYFLAVSREIVSIGEMALLSKGKEESDILLTAEKFVDKRLFKGRTGPNRRATRRASAQCNHARPGNAGISRGGCTISKTRFR